MKRKTKTGLQKCFPLHDPSYRIFMIAENSKLTVHSFVISLWEDNNHISVNLEFEQKTAAKNIAVLNQNAKHIEIQC